MWVILLMCLIINFDFKDVCLILECNLICLFKFCLGILYFVIELEKKVESIVDGFYVKEIYNKMDSKNKVCWRLEGDFLMIGSSFVFD